MVLSKACSYGILATLYIARKEKEGYVPIREISDQLKISFHFLTKILQTLTENEILESFRGPKGGVRIKKDPADITLYDIITAIDGSDIFTQCLLGLPGCGEAKPCPMHEYWSVARTRLRENFENKNLSQISERIDELKLRLSNDIYQ